MKLRKLENEPPQTPVLAPGEAHRQELRRKRSGYRLTVLIVLGVVFAAGLLYGWWRSRWVLTTGRVIALQIHVASPLLGRLAEMPLREGERVDAGRLVARLDDAELNIELRKAEARRESAQARRASLEQPLPDATQTAAAETARRDLDLARLRLARAEAAEKQARALDALARETVERQEKLLLLQATTRDALQKARAEAQKARADAERAAAEAEEAKAAVPWAERLLEARWQILEQERSVRESQRKILAAEIEAEVGRAEADLSQIRLRLGQTAVHAPRAGVVSWIGKRAGEVVDHNDVIVTLMDPGERWVEAYVSAAELSELRDGAEASVRFEGVVDRDIPGRVLLYYPPETGVRTDVEVRVPAHLARLLHAIRIEFPGGLPPEVRPEMMARVSIRKSAAP